VPGDELRSAFFFNHRQRCLWGWRQGQRDLALLILCHHTNKVGENEVRIYSVVNTTVKRNLFRL
jgi:hypothetical protein